MKTMPCKTLSGKRGLGGLLVFLILMVAGACATRPVSGEEQEGLTGIVDHAIVAETNPDAVPVTVPEVQAEPEPVNDPLLTPEQLEQLVGPIALFPDDLIAIILPASTYPVQIVQAARYLELHQRDPGLTTDEDWDDSVVALLNYPEAPRMLDQDLDWTWDLGGAVLNQQVDVLDAIQRFRQQALAAGNLQSDERQQVAVEEGTVQIRPADPEVIYVPRYEPERVIVYQEVPVYQYYSTPYPVYYYPYGPDYRFRTRYFWGLSSAFYVGWNSRYLSVYPYDYFGHPYYGSTFYFDFYRSNYRPYRRPWQRGVTVNVNVNNYTDRDGYRWRHVRDGSARGRNRGDGTYADRQWDYARGDDRDNSRRPDNFAPDTNNATRQAYRDRATAKEDLANNGGNRARTGTGWRNSGRDGGTASSEQQNRAGRAVRSTQAQRTPRQAAPATAATIRMPRTGPAATAGEAANTSGAQQGVADTNPSTARTATARYRGIPDATANAAARYSGRSDTRVDNNSGDPGSRVNRSRSTRGIVVNSGTVAIEPAARVRAPGTAAYRAPAQAVNRAPARAVTREPVTTRSEARVYRAPAEAAYRAPVEAVTRDPVAPRGETRVYRAPAQAAYRAPVEAATGRPVASAPAAAYRAPARAASPAPAATSPVTRSSEDAAPPAGRFKSGDRR